MNFNTQLAFIPQAVIVEAREDEAEPASARLFSRKAKPQVKIDGSIDHGIRAFAVLRVLFPPVLRSLADAPRCRLTQRLLFIVLYA